MIRKNKNNIKALLITVVALVVVNIIASNMFLRFDLTYDKRYTLSETSLNIVNDIPEPLYVDVFLKGDFPGEFKKLQSETQQLLEEFKAYNSNIVFQFVDPLENEEERELIMDSFLQRGLTPVNVTMSDKGKQTQEVVFPWAIATYGEKSVKIPLLKNSASLSTAEKVVSSVQHLEYAFANAFNAVSKNKEKKVAVIKGNGELHDLLMADFIRDVRDHYFIGTFTLDSVATKPNESLKYLQKYDVAIIAKPTERFTDEEKLVLDQFIINGGKTMWLVDQVSIEMDSLYNEQGTSLAFPRDLNLNDMFFKYGFRINPSLIKDVMATPIALATGEMGGSTQYTQYPWFYSPWIYPEGKHPIINNMDGLKLEFANPIDTLKNGIKKTVLLRSSQYSKVIGSPVEVSLDMVQERPEPTEFASGGHLPVALLLEGKFSSVYENRVLPFKESSFKPTGKMNKMIVVSDGDIIKNQLDKDFQPLELGFDKWTSKVYANKEFLINSLNYLLDDTGLIDIRSKHVELPILDQEKVYANYTASQIITVGAPIVILLMFGVLFTFLRRRKYGRKY